LFVYSFDIEKQELVVGKVNKIWKTGTKKVYKITYEWWFNTPQGRIYKTNSIKVTANHKFLLKKWQHKDPFKGINKKGDIYLSIEDGLTIGHSLQPFYRHENLGYSYVGVKSSKQIREGRFLLGYKLKKDLIKKEEQCHHKDENKLNDTYNNLELEMIDEHSRYHTSKNNVMFDKKVKEKHNIIMQSQEYKNKQSETMKEVFKNPEIYKKRLKQIEETNEQRSLTVKDKHKNPSYRYNFLMGLLKRKNSSLL